MQLSEEYVEDSFRADTIWYAIGIAALLGSLYGLFVTPVWSEAVQFGQTWAGLIDCNRNALCDIILKDPSLQITLPALLLKLGFGIWPLSLFFSALFAALGMAAITAACFALTRHTLFSVTVAVLLLTYQFGNPYGYPAVYPSSASQFGQTGQYLCLLALAFAAFGRLRTAGVIGGLLAGMHAVWCLGFLLAVLPVLFWLRQRLRPLLLTFLIVACAALTFQKLSLALLPAHPVYEAPHIPANAEPHPVPKPTRLKYHGHNVLFADAVQPWHAGAAFFLSIGVFAAAMTIRLRTQKRDAGTNLLWMVASLTCAVTFFKLYEELDPQFSLPALFSDPLPNLILRAIFNRLFNLAGLMVPLLFAAFVFHAAFIKRSIAGLAVLVGLCFIARTPWYIVPPFQSMAPDALQFTPPAHWGFYIAILLLPLLIQLEHYFLRRLPVSVPTRHLPLAASVCLLLFISFRLDTSLTVAQMRKAYFRHDAADAITAVISQDKGQLILAPELITPRGDYAAQLRTGRATITAAVIDIYDPQTRKVIGVFCKSYEPYEPFFEFYANVRTCFEHRPVQEWRAIAKELPAEGLLTPASWKLRLKPTASGANLNYYRLPQ